ncbi:MAG: hypothetical protein ACFFDN_01595 [Candidatus Hodarchaeota archaeon]
MKVFLSGSFKDREKIAEWMDKINSIKNVKIIYDWTEHTWDEDRKKYAEENLLAVHDCDIFVFDVGEYGSLGKSILLGAALTLKKEIYIIGQFPEIIFADLIPDDHKFENFQKFYEFLSS